MHIRVATSHDQKDIHCVYWSAFPEGEREMVAKLAVDLLSEHLTPQVVSLVAEIEGVVVGHTAFSPVTIENKENFQAYILAPLGVKPDHQKRRIGSRLIENGIQQLSEMGVDILLVYGDPKYYSRFGFRMQTAERYIPPYELQYPFGWQGIAFNEHGIGKSPVKITCVASLRNPALW